MQLKSALLLSGCAWLVAAPLLATASSVHHAEHGVAAGTLGAKHRRTDLKEVHEEQGGHGEGQRREGPEEPSLPESSYHCWHEGTAEEENKFTELGPHSQHTVCSYHNLYLWNGQASLLFMPSWRTTTPPPPPSSPR